MTSKYQENIDKLLSDGYAEVVPSGEIPVPGSTWFLPHHGVTSEAKPGKLRVVFDCAAQQAGVSLNNQCYQGPDQNNKLLHVLLRFRQFPFAIMADVEAMYHQVRVPAYDRNCLRFLWRVNGLNVEYRMTSHLFGGVWCSSSSTFALRQTVIDCPTSQLVEDTVRKSFYVDDLLKSVKTRDEAVEVIHGTKLAVKFGGFNLTKFVVNDSHLLDSIAEHDRAQEVKEIHPEMLSKALGIKWNVTDDTFYYISKCPDSHAEVTRRIMLSQVSSMYDPLGLISPVVMQGKALFQEATRLKLGWDVPVPEDLSFQWLTWLLSLSELSSLSFSRCVIPDAFVDGAMELHHFCDASMRGYGACTYIRIVNCHGDVHVALVASKARLAPLRQLSIPRLELLAATVAVKLDSVVSRELEVPILSSTYWSDSQIVLAYITNETRRFKTFVANRVANIRGHSLPSQWKHIEGDSNPADVLSRGCNPGNLPTSWYRGPEFLAFHKSEWQVPTLTNPCVAFDGDPEVKSSSAVTSGESVVLDTGVDDTSFMSHPLDMLIGHYSSFHRLKKALCWLLRVRMKLIDKAGAVCGLITVTEMRNAEMLLVKHAQKSSFERELAALQSGKCVSRSSRICNLSPKMVNGILVVGGRVSRLKCPVILSHQHPLSHKIITELHNTAHLGTEWLLSILRENYWVTRARSLINKVKGCCVICKKRLVLQCCKRWQTSLLKGALLNNRHLLTQGLICLVPFMWRWVVLMLRDTVVCTHVSHLGLYISKFLAVWKLTPLSMVFFDSFPDVDVLWRSGRTMGQTWLERKLSYLEVCAALTAPRSSVQLDKKWLSGFFTLHCPHILVAYGNVRFEPSGRSFLVSSTPVPEWQMKSSRRLSPSSKTPSTADPSPKAVMMSTTLQHWPRIICYWWEITPCYLGLIVMSLTLTARDGDKYNIWPVSFGGAG